ncbi:MAG: urease accessory protein ureF [Polyangiaceae bacterium]|nr:urease accessory protein ureF [Polyangiaceae bacterium]
MGTITITTDSASAVSSAALLRLYQLSSAALPIGAFAYSQGLEQAVALGDVKCQPSSCAWIVGMLERSVLTLDVPVFARLHRAFESGQLAEARRWNDYLFAARGSAELRAEERQTGSALVRLLSREGVEPARPWLAHPRVTLATGFALASVVWSAPLTQAALAYVFAWAEAQVGAATRLIPLGQTDAQRTLTQLVERAAQGIDRALRRTDDQLSSSTPGQLLLSALHETQYSRLFRS